MIDLAPVYAALQKADAAGDTAGAKQLADYIRSQPASPVAPSGKSFDAAAAGSVPAPPPPPAGWAVDAVAEPALNIGTSMIAAPAAGLSGLAAVAARGLGLSDADPADVVRNVQSSLSYQPRTEAGQSALSMITYPFRKLGSLADYAGQKTSEFTGSPLAGAAVNTGVQMLPALVTRSVMRSAPAAAGANAARSASEAESYVANRTSLDWNSLSDAVKAKLTDIAGSAGALDKLDPAAVERQAQLESLPAPVPATQGQLTRDPVQLRNEGNVSATDAGQPIRDIHVAQNKALLDNLDILQNKVAGVNRTAPGSDEQAGASLQDAARGKLALQQGNVKALYAQAEAQGELQGKVSPKPLLTLLDTSPDLTHLGYVQSWLDKMGVVDKTDSGTVVNKLSLKDMEDLRQAAVARAMNGGTDGYYAGKVANAIDQSTAGAGGAAYQAARAARKAQAMEFQDQGGVARLVDNKSRTDRATALEDTWQKTVRSGSIEDLRNVKRTLLTGGDQSTRMAGRAAWRDLRAQTIQHITDDATKGVSRYEDGSPSVAPAALQRALGAIGPDKLEEIFGPGTVKQLGNIMDAARIVKTEPPAGFKGSPTFANAIAFLEKGLNKIPLVGPVVSGVARLGAKAYAAGRSGRDAAAAQETPISQGLAGAYKSTLAQRRWDALRSTAAPNSLAAMATGNGQGQ
jgi:hypothetical protein